MCILLTKLKKLQISSKSMSWTIKKRVWKSGILYLLSQCRELNSGPFPYQGNALPLSYIGFYRAEDRVRTGDIQLGRLTLYQLSYFRLIEFCGESRIRTCEGINQQIYSLSSLAAWVSPLKSRWRDSNPRPADYKSAALASWATSAI